MFLAWAVLIPFSSAIAKHFHHWGKIWFRLHVSMNILASLFMIIAFALMLWLNGASFSSLHTVNMEGSLTGSHSLSLPGARMDDNFRDHPGSSSFGNLH